MGLIRNNIYLTLLYVVFLVEVPLNLASYSNNNEKDEYKTGLTRRHFLHNRILEDFTMSCSESVCSKSGGSLNKKGLDSVTDYTTTYSIALSPGSEIQLDIAEGGLRRDLTFTLATDPKAMTKTDIKLNPSDSYPANIIPSVSDSSWERKLTISVSTSSSRSFQIYIKNESSEPTDVKFQIEVGLFMYSYKDVVDLAVWLAPTVIFIVLIIVVLIYWWIKDKIQKRKRRQAHEVKVQTKPANGSQTDPVYKPVDQQSPTEADQETKTTPESAVSSPVTSPVQQVEQIGAVELNIRTEEKPN